MSTIKEDLKNLKERLKYFKRKKGSENIVRICEEEIEMYEDALKVKNITEEIECVESEMYARNSQIAKLSVLNREDKKYINILRRRLEEEKLSKNPNTNTEEKLHEKQERDESLES